MRTRELHVVATYHVNWLNVAVWGCALAVGVAFLTGLVIACLKVAS